MQPYVEDDGANEALVATLDQVAIAAMLPA
jgi:hypothetical protein